MKEKTSIRYFNEKPIRSRWCEESSAWFICAIDLIEAVIRTENPRIYWYAFKKRNPEIVTFCKQLKMTAADGKAYDTDCLSDKGIECLLDNLPKNQRGPLRQWIGGGNSSLDERSKGKAHELIASSVIDDIEVGTITGLRKIHAYIFGGLYPFAGQVRTKNLSKNGFLFANADYLDKTLALIDAMPQESLEDIIAKYIEMNIAHPFMEGNGRATRIWLDQMLKSAAGQCVDWSKIDKEDYLLAMVNSPIDPQPISDLIRGALTSAIDDREMLMKGIDYSYYYEEVE